MLSAFPSAFFWHLVDFYILINIIWECIFGLFDILLGRSMYVAHVALTHIPSHPSGSARYDRSVVPVSRQPRSAHLLRVCSVTSPSNRTSALSSRRFVHRRIDFLTICSARLMGRYWRLLPPPPPHRQPPQQSSRQLMGKWRTSLVMSGFICVHTILNI